MEKDLQQKVTRALRLIEAAGRDGHEVEVAYSGGKDSDIVLRLTQMAGVKYRAIYHSSTIDPPGTIAYAQSRGAEIVRPEKSFRRLVEENGMPNRFQRHCCRLLKESPTLDRILTGVRRDESTVRAARYQEPTECRVYGKGQARRTVEMFYPILDWTIEDEFAFVLATGMQLHPFYYDNEGILYPERRLGCMCCPLQSYEKRIESFRQYPGMVRFYVTSAAAYLNSHPDTVTARRYADAYEWFVREVFFERDKHFRDHMRIVASQHFSHKVFLEQFFGITLP